MPFTESQITFDLSGHEYFAFENCPGYQRRSPHHLGEMDLGWYEPRNQSLYIAELKDFSVSLQATDPKLITKVIDLFHKSLSVIAMLTAVRSGPLGADIASCLPPSWPPTNPVHLLHIIHCSTADEVKLSFMKDKLVEFMRPQYLQLFNIASCTILSHRQAVNQFPQIISQIETNTMREAPAARATGASSVSKATPTAYRSTVASASVATLALSSRTAAAMPAASKPHSL